MQDAGRSETLYEACTCLNGAGDLKEQSCCCSKPLEGIDRRRQNMHKAIRKMDAILVVPQGSIQQPRKEGYSRAAGKGNKNFKPAE
eukprot:762982-Hanusia_phi.AAC.8